MKSSAIFLAAFFGVASSAALYAQPVDRYEKPTESAAAVGGPVILGYYPCWAEEPSPAKINYGLFTHLVHAFATVEKGKLSTSGNLPSRQLTERAHAAHVRVLLGLGGAGSRAAFDELVKDASATETLIRSVVAMVTEYGYDGIDLDWEFPAEADQLQMASFVKELRQALRTANPKALLTMPVPATDWYGRWFPMKEIGESVDLVEVMSYDLHGPWKNDRGTAYSHSGHNSPLYGTSSDPIDGADFSYRQFVDYWRSRGVQSDKLVIGIPCYGHGFAVRQWAVEPKQAAMHPSISFNEIQTLLSEGWLRHWDAEANEPWIESPAGEPVEMVSYDDEQSAAAKGQWAHNARIRGIFFWEISQDYADRHNKLVEAARLGFLSRTK